VTGRSRPIPGSEKTFRHDPYAAFRVPAYRNYMAGSLLVQIGTGAQGIAIGWEMYQRTNQPLALGLVGLAQAVPMIAMSLPAGYLADRFDRKKLLIASLLGASLLSVALAVLSATRGPTLLMYLLLFLDSAVLTLGRPARTALLPLLVPREIFANAVAWRTSMQQIAAVTGPALGGLILAHSLPAVYLVSAGSTLLFALFLSRMVVPRGETAATSASLESLLAGVRFVFSQRLILATISLDLFAVLFGGAVYLLPIYARDILQVGETGLGSLRAAPAAGAFCTAILLAHLPPMQSAGRNLLLAVAGFGVATILFGLSRSFWLSLAMLFLTGAFDNVSVVVRHTLLQLLTPDAMRGRVSAVNAVFIGSSNELGGFESGLVAEIFSPTISVVSGGIGTLIVVGVMAARSRELREFGALRDARPLG
jgi:MFS family permease